MKIHKRQLYSLIPIVMGGVLMRLSWVYMPENISPFMVGLGTVIFLAGVIWFFILIFRRNKGYR